MCGLGLRSKKNSDPSTTGTGTSAQTEDLSGFSLSSAPSWLGSGDEPRAPADILSGILRELQLSDWEIKASELEILTNHVGSKALLGAGGFGQVLLLSQSAAVGVCQCNQASLALPSCSDADALHLSRTGWCMLAATLPEHVPSALYRSVCARMCRGCSCKPRRASPIS